MLAKKDHVRTLTMRDYFIFPECEPGFYGFNCPCSRNYFGRLCQDKCHCSPDKFCDHVRGCVCKDTCTNKIH